MGCEFYVVNTGVRRRGLVDPSRALAQLPVHTAMSNAAHTTFVADAPQGKRLYFDGHPMSGTARGAQTYMRLMAHLPLLAQRGPRDALVIGFGVGNTAAAIALHQSIQNIDVAKLNDRVIATAPQFASTNASVIDAPRLRVCHGDGRAVLELRSQHYDLITTESPPPRVARLRWAARLSNIASSCAGAQVRWQEVMNCLPRSLLCKAVH